jgi:hypothetical protein
LFPGPDFCACARIAASGNRPKPLRIVALRVARGQGLVSKAQILRKGYMFVHRHFSGDRVLSKYREQFERVKRWHEKLKAFDAYGVHDVDPIESTDVIYAFFMNCYHLKEWIKNDECVQAQLGRTSLELNEDLNHHINANMPLMLCADIANSIKHLDRTSNRSKEQPSVPTPREGYRFPNLQLITTWEVHTKTERMSAFDLATDCVGCWREFLTARGLSV